MDDDDEQPTNIFKFGAVDGGKKEESKIPQNDYVVVDIDGTEYDVNGFLVFTPHHLAIMTDEGDGVIPGLVLPIARVKTAVLASIIDGEDQLPF
jgi:hypothetical protein